VQWVILE